MRILGITETCDLGSLYLRLIAGGHEVRVSISNPLAAGTMNNMVPRSDDWEADLQWVRSAGEEGLVVFEGVGFGRLQDELRSSGLRVVGGSEFGDRLENDRAVAQRWLGELGLNTAPNAEFDRVEEALADLARRPRRCVLKLSASAGDTFVGALPDGRDIAALLKAKAPVGRFILMDHVDGVETGVGAFFNGSKFIRPACLDWEHKRFFPGDMGELTGEMGTVATFDHSDTMFEATLAKMEEEFSAAGHVGWVNLNLIVNDRGLWPLEFTCRFGYPGFAVLEPLQAIDWSDLLRGLADGTLGGLPTHQGFSVGVVLSTPPFPLSRDDVDYPVGLPVIADSVPGEHCHFGEVGLEDGQLVTSGLYGWTLVVTGVGQTIEQAQDSAYRSAGTVIAPNLRYRRDIGDKLALEQLQQLIDWGWIKSMPSSRIASQIVR